jgi:molecular chaperone GrpE (heat shock protein)
MSVACAWCQDLAARKADEALTDMVAKAVIEIASLREQLAQAEVAVNLAREAAGQWKSEAEECSESYAHWFRSANDQAKLRGQAETERDEALRLAYIGEHHFPDLSWKARCEEIVQDLQRADRELAAKAAAAENERDSLLNMVDSLTRALRGLLLSRDASWVGGHDWMEAVDDACKALGIEPGEDAE